MHVLWHVSATNLAGFIREATTPELVEDAMEHPVRDRLG